MKFQVIPERESFVAEQGVWLTVVATNISNEPVSIVWGDYPYDDLFEFEVVRPDGAMTPPPRRRLCPPVEALTARDILTLAPGESRERAIVLAMMPGANIQTFRFVYPGTYLIRSQVRLISVRPAADGADYFESASEPTDIACENIEVAVQAPVPDPTLFCSMTGLVVDSNGEPVPSVEIDVEAQHQGFYSIDGLYWQHVDRVATDREGRFSIEGLDRGVARHRLHFHHPEHPFASLEIPTRTNEGIIELDPITLADGYLMEGLVTDNNCVPIVGARVTTGVRRDLWTNREGRFRDTGFPTALEGLESPPHLQAWKRGWVESGPPSFERINGEVRLHQVLVPETQQQVSGFARFANGEVAADLDLYVYRDPSDGYPIEAATDAAGRFAVDWPAYPGQTNHGLVAVLEQGERHLPRRTWVASFDDLQPGQSDVEFVFDSSRRLEVDVIPSKELPESTTMTVNVSLKLAGNREQILFAEQLPSTGGQLAWDRLSPGSYLVNVRIDRAEHWNWTQEVAIGSDDEVAAECRVELPELLFGSATLQVVTSDSVTPWPSGDLWMDSTYGWGPVPVRAGRATIRDVPAGPIHVEVHTDGYARTHLHGEILPGETVELGTLKALTLEEGTGLVFGRVLLSGGGPAIGARVEVQGGSYGRAPHLGGDGVDGDGLFEIRLDPGRQTLGVDVDHVTALAGDNEVQSSEFAMFSQRRLNAAVDVVAGGETQIEITVPEMTGEVQITGQPIGTAMLNMPIDDSLSYQDMMPFVFDDATTSGAAFTRVPHGLAQISISRGLPESEFPDTADGFRNVWEHHWANVSSDPAVVEVGNLAAGRLRVRLRNAAGVPIASYMLKAAPAFDALPAEVQAARQPEQIQSTGAYIETGVGIMYLAPGRYEATVTHQGQTITRTVEIRDGETVDLDLMATDE